MDVFGVHRQLIADYQAFTTGFVEIRDRRIARHVQERLDNGDQWPDPYLSLNPNFASGGSVADLVADGLLHPECEWIFRVGKDDAGAPGQVVDLHLHQREAVEIARGDAGYALTTGTGSGKSLAYMVPIVDWILRQKDAGSYVPGVKAIAAANATAGSCPGWTVTPTVTAPPSDTCSSVLRWDGPTRWTRLSPSSGYPRRG